MPNFKLTTPVVLIMFSKLDTARRVFAEIARAKPAKLLVISDAARPDKLGEAEDDGGEMVCEHVQLHAAIRAHGGRIFINPGLINTGYTSHTKKLLLRSRIRRQIKALWGAVITDSIKALISLVAPDNIKK
jgi:hypothetical protein